MSGRSVCVIGGGVIGLSTAFALGRQGFKVRLLEASKKGIGHGTSFANGGQLSYRYVAPFAAPSVPFESIKWMLDPNGPLVFTPDVDPVQWKWCMSFLMACNNTTHRQNAQVLLKLALESQSELHEWKDSLEDFHWLDNGKLVAFRSQKALDKARSSLVDPETQQVLDKQAVLDLEPSLAAWGDDLSGAVFTPGDEVGDCFKFCEALVKSPSSNFEICLDAKVLGFNFEEGTRTINSVETTLGNVEADHFVLAAGLESVALGKMLDIDLPLYPLKGYSLSVDLDSDVVKRAVPAISVTDYENKICYAKLGTDVLRVAAMVDIGGDKTDSVNSKRMEQLFRQCKEAFPGIDFENGKQWAGLRPATPTGVPIIGESGYQNLHLNVGHGALGFTLACGSAKRIVERLTVNKN
mmetsp:Transcript_2788/g.3998  ORF Transcript_2788/g.3998 Transcript_2788/m.3998 type:complete len:409 (+) Transcript_2788:1124-2350(+)